MNELHKNNNKSRVQAIRWLVLYGIVVVIGLILATVLPRMLDAREEEYRQYIEELLQERLYQQELIDDLIEENRKLWEINEELFQKFDELFEHLEPLQEIGIVRATVTNYAPLDPNAVEGMCHDGNPYVTASGSRTTIGRTVAADPSVPFGTKVWVEGYGWRVVEDRGGAIRDGNERGDRLDVAIGSRSTALARGPHKRWAIFVWKGE